MSHRLLILLVVVACLTSGCCRQRCNPILGSLASARIAAPGTNTIQYPRSASLPTPYYGPAPSTGAPSDINTSNGWRGAGQLPMQPVTTNASSTNLVPVSPIPTNNMATASNTSNLTARGNLQVAEATTGTVYTNSTIPNGQVNPYPGSGGMRLNDATQIAGSIQPATNGNSVARTWEYAVRPTPVSGYRNAVANSGQIQPYGGQLYPASQPYNGPAPAGSATGFLSPVPNSQPIVADQWRQRDPNSGIAR